MPVKESHNADAPSISDSRQISAFSASFAVTNVAFSRAMTWLSFSIKYCTVENESIRSRIR